MRGWLQRAAVFAGIVGLIAGGLGWASAEALRMEETQQNARLQQQRADRLRRALWRLDGLVAPQLARESGRPFAHFFALYVPIPAINRFGVCLPPGEVRVPSPLLDAELPSWVRLHFQYTPTGGEETRWQSPQVLPSRERSRLQQDPFALPLTNVTPVREAFLAEFCRRCDGEQLLVEVRRRSPSTTQSEPAVELKGESDLQMGENFRQQPENRGDWANNPPYQQAQGRQTVADPDNALRKEVSNTIRFAPRGGKGVDPAANLDLITAPKAPPSAVGDVSLASMTPLWFPSAAQPDYLVYARLARFGSREIVQGVIIDWPRLREELRLLVEDLFPDGQLAPLPEGADPDGEGVMTALPIVFDPGPLPPIPRFEWTPLRIGLVVAWAAVLLALLAIVLSGWSLIDLSERRIRFVSAVTHELRTPLTTLRLYLDMLTSGLIRDESQKSEYLRTLNIESERLHRLIGNVLDFARLEKQNARPALTDVAVGDLVDQLRSTWLDRCESAGKELIVESMLPSTAVLNTDAILVQQILGNLIDNACKYSKSASDRRVWLRIMEVKRGRIAFEVEDRGPGVGRRDWRSVFRPFQRGREADVTAGGVGLGLALARRWSAMLGGRLELRRCASGACFRFELPV